jgi:18S rRNA (guanine1575-N7)-methyltransferase
VPGGEQRGVGHACRAPVALLQRPVRLVAERRKGSLPVLPEERRAAIKAGFGAGLLEDDEGTKNAKTYLVLTVGGGQLDGDITGVVRGMDGVEVMETRRKAKGTKLRDEKKGSKAWILKKKDQMEKQGRVVKATSKYTGRKRRIQF